jgi:hypothetical protein
VHIEFFLNLPQVAELLSGTGIGIAELLKDAQKDIRDSFSSNDLFCQWYCYDSDAIIDTCSLVNNLAESATEKSIAKLCSFCML